MPLPPIAVSIACTACTISTGVVAAPSVGSRLATATGRFGTSASLVTSSPTTFGLLLFARIAVQMVCTAVVGLLAASDCTPAEICAGVRPALWKIERIWERFTTAILVVLRLLGDR